MGDISSEAKKLGLREPEKELEEMTDEELKEFRNSFDPDMMGFDGTEGIEEDIAALQEEREGEVENEAD